MPKIKKQKDSLIEYSPEYQRMLAGIRVYFSLMKQRSTMNFLFVIILMMLFLVSFTIWQAWETIKKTNVLFNSVLYNSILPMFSALIIIIILIVLFSISFQFDFKVRKGIRIFFKSPLALFLMLPYFFLIIIIAIQGNSSYADIVSTIVFSIIILFVFVLVLSLTNLKPKSLLNYAAEKLEKTLIETKHWRLDNSGYYVQYYYAILTYYRLVTKRYRSMYKDDILLKTHSQLIPLLCSKGLISKTEDKKILISNLNELSQIDPIENPNSFTDKMQYLKENILKDINEDEIKKIYSILRDKTGKEKLKEYLFYLITALSIIGTILTTISDKILSWINTIFHT